jgi:hypothetical protein
VRRAWGPTPATGVVVTVLDERGAQLRRIHVQIVTGVPIAVRLPTGGTVTLQGTSKPAPRTRVDLATRTAHPDRGWRWWWWRGAQRHDRDHSTERFA